MFEWKTPSVKTWTFLFTDIEDSTGHYERSGQIYRTAAAQHFELLRAAIAAHGGEIFRNTGDGLLAIFRDSRGALACAAACQQALRATEWSHELGELRVRIGLHRGEAERAAGDFHGLTMHHATRVMDAAHGAQILCSAAVRDHAGAEGGAPLGDLGLYRLRGVPTPMRLFQVSYEGMPGAGFPAPRTPAAFTHKLPAPPTRFFGREAELHDLATMLAAEPPGRAHRRHGRLVTLLGPGGTGKTRLSLAAGEQMLAAFSHAVWFVPLAEVRDASLLPDVLRAALEIAPEPGRTPLDQITTMLAVQPVLLILDNFEQLVPRGVEFVRTLLERAPQVVCLVTSRVRLDLSAEQDFTLAALLLPPSTGTPEELLRYPSVQLYCDRAVQARRDFRLTGENAPDVAKVCRTLEGIPLAIELAAARAAMLTPRQMLAKLGHRLDFLVGRKRDFAHRHRTLRATVAWSYELLAEPLQRLFARLSVFRGGWSLEAAEAVVAENAALFEQLSELHSSSLITAVPADGAMRYAMYETIREYAAECLLASGEVESLLARHHSHFLQLCRSKPADEAVYYRQLLADEDNVRAMLGGPGPIEERPRAAVCLYPFWMNRGTLREGRDWLRRLREAMPHELDATGAAAANADAILAWKAGDYVDAQLGFEKALRFWEEQGNEPNVAGLLNNLGILAVDRGNYVEAQESYERSLAIYRGSDAPVQLATVHCNYAGNCLRTRDFAAAGTALAQSEELLRANGDLPLLANTLHNCAEWHARLRRFSQARRALAECLAIRRSLLSEDCIAASWVTVAGIALEEGLIPHAVVCAAAASMARWRRAISSRAISRAVGSVSSE